MISSRTVLACAALSLLLLNTGCSLLYNLQPHRLMRLNRGPAPSIDPEFSEFKPKRSIRMAQKAADPKAPTMSVNSADVVVVRAQSPQSDYR